MEKKEKIYYLSMIKNGGNEKFFGSVVASEPVDQTLNVVRLDPSPPGEAVLQGTLQGLANTSHNVEVLLNDISVGSVVFTGQGQGTLQASVSQAGLKEGDNVVRLIARGGETDVTKKRKDFKRPDAIRSDLASQGIIIEDKPDGTSRWKR